MIPLIHIRLCIFALLLLTQQQLLAKTLNYTCDNKQAPNCLVSELGAANIHCSDKDKDKKNDSVDLLKLAHAAPALTGLAYNEKAAKAEIWTESKLKSIDACLTEQQLSGDLPEIDLALNTTLQVLALEKSISKCNSDLSFINVTEPDPKANGLNKTQAYIQACETKLKIAINTNNKSDEQSVKASLKLLKTKLEKQADAMVLQSGVAGFDVHKALKTTQQSKLFFSQIDSLTGLTGQDFLIPSWRDTALSYQFYTGVEYNKVDDLFSNSSLRIGMLTYLRLGKEVERLRDRTEDKCDLYASCGSWWWHIPHIFGSFTLTGAAESAGTGDLDDMDSIVSMVEDDQTAGDFDSLEYEIGVFWPAYLGSRGSKEAKTYQELAFGPIVSIGGRVTEEDSSFQDRIYAGFRFSNNEETYFDLMVGTSQPLEGKRLELRGQLPVSKLGSGRLFLGGSANLQISKKDDPDSGDPVREPDSFKIYVTWQTTFDEIWKGFDNDE